MSRTIYVAGGSDERAECKSDIEALRAAGWTITHDWTEDPGFRDPPEPDTENSLRSDIEGVRKGAFFWLRCPLKKSEGAHAELGAAIIVRDVCNLMMRTRCIIVSGPWDSGHRLFTHAADLKFSKHEQALSWLLEYAP